MAVAQCLDVQMNTEVIFVVPSSEPMKKLGSFYFLCVTSGAGPRAVGTERGRWSE